MVALLALLALAAGCAHVATRTAVVPEERVVWPPPPDPPRIELLQTIAGPADVGIRRSFWNRVASFVSGRPRLDEMQRPHGVALADDGRILVADPDASCVHMFDHARARYRRLQRAGPRALVTPIGVATDQDGRVYVSDAALRAIFRFDAQGEWIDAFGEGGELARPAGLAYDRARRTLIVADAAGHKIDGYDVAGRRTWSIGRRGSAEGEFNYPVAVAVSATGRLYVSDSMNYRVQMFDAEQRFVRAFGQPGVSPGDFDKAKGIAVDGDGHVYVVEGLHDVVQIYDAEGRLLTVVGGSGDRPGQFWLPAGIFIDGENRIVVADAGNRRVQLLRYLGERKGNG